MISPLFVEHIGENSLVEMPSIDRTRVFVQDECTLYSFITYISTVSLAKSIAHILRNYPNTHTSQFVAS